MVIDNDNTVEENGPLEIQITNTRKKNYIGKLF